MPRAADGENDHVLAAALGRNELYSLDGRICLVTGGGSGIGAMIAGGFVANGATVVIASRKDCSIFAAQLSAKGPGKCVAMAADLTKQADLDRIVSEVARTFGKLHILVNNAGANWGEPLEQFSIAGWNKTNDLNVTAVFNTIKCSMQLLKAAAVQGDPARIINIASIDGLTTPALDTFAYSAGKAAVIHMSSVLAGRLVDENITVNCICPGAFQSRMMRGTIEMAGEKNLAQRLMGTRIGSPEDIAGACVFLSSRAGAWMTGAKLTLDGGAVALPRL
jgi:NAD(P)-dependent dehydrogenase (short-subunit alcohol dehydrogenase family)